MTEAEIAELFIQAAETDQRLPQTAKPARLKAMNHGYFHDQKDIDGWSGQRYEQERADFFDARSTRLTKNQVAVWELSLEMIKIIPKTECRRSLWAWAAAKAGGVISADGRSRMSLAKWARTVENIHPETASRRAKAAITAIHHKLECTVHLHNGKRLVEVLPDEPEIGHKTSNIEVWRPDDAKPLRAHFDTDLAGLEWAAIQSAKRRDREARRRRAA